KAVRIAGAKMKEATVERTRAVAIVLASELARAVRPKGVYGRLVLANGSRLSLASARSDGWVLNAKTLLGATIQVPLAEVVELRMHQGRAIYLSDLKPIHYQHTPYLGVAWPYRNDTSVVG